MPFVGHVLRHKDISCDLRMGSVYENRGRSRPKTRYSDNIRDRAGIRSVVAIYRQAQDREKWRATAVRRQISVSCSLPSLFFDISVNWIKQPGSV